MNDAVSTVRLCGAWGRQAQRPCRRAVTPGRTRCNLHGGKNPGPPAGNQHATVHGNYSAAALAAKRAAAAAGKLARHEVAQAKEAVDVALAAAASPRKRRARVKATVDGGSLK